MKIGACQFSVTSDMPSQLSADPPGPSRGPHRPGVPNAFLSGVRAHGLSTPRHSPSRCGRLRTGPAAATASWSAWPGRTECRSSWERSLKQMDVIPMRPCSSRQRDGARYIGSGRCGDGTPSTRARKRPGRLRGGRRQNRPRICYEIRFPEYFRELYVENTDLNVILFYDVSDRDNADRYDLIRAHVRMRAVENVCHKHAI